MSGIAARQASPSQDRAKNWCGNQGSLYVRGCGSASVAASQASLAARVVLPANVGLQIVVESALIGQGARALNGKATAPVTALRRPIAGPAPTHDCCLPGPITYEPGCLHQIPAHHPGSARLAEP